MTAAEAIAQIRELGEKLARDMKCHCHLKVVMVQVDGS
jgi:hypothetical protein